LQVAFAREKYGGAIFRFLISEGDFVRYGYITRTVLGVECRARCLHPEAERRKPYELYVANKVAIVTGGGTGIGED
jgi:hypothetical protein